MWGIFNDDAADWTAEESVEDDFLTEQDAMKAIAERYSEEDELIAHEIEESEEEEDDEE